MDVTATEAAEVTSKVTARNHNVARQTRQPLTLVTGQLLHNLPTCHFYTINNFTFLFYWHFFQTFPMCTESSTFE